MFITVQVSTRSQQKPALVDPSKQTKNTQFQYKSWPLKNQVIPLASNRQTYSPTAPDTQKAVVEYLKDKGLYRLIGCCF